MRNFVSTAASALPGHPDKLCDRISDAVVDATLALEPAARITAETALASGVVFLACHGTSRLRIDHGEVVREIIAEAGYRAPVLDPDRVSVMVSLGELERAEWDGLSGAELASRLPATTNVSVFGYACRQSADFLPAPIALAHDLARTLERYRLTDEPGLQPDGQVQVCIGYEERRPVRLLYVTALATGERADDHALTARVEDRLRARIAGGGLDHAGVRLLVNPPGAVLSGGPARHPGLTGRKTGMDSYGDHVRHGGAALSGKDPTRIDRIGAYAARHCALGLVAAGLAEECEVQISYAVGQVAPIGIEIDTYGSGRYTDERLSRALRAVADLRPGAILERFGLRDRSVGASGIFFRSLSSYGQVGAGPLPRPWESPDLAEALAAAV